MNQNSLAYSNVDHLEKVEIVLWDAIKYDLDGDLIKPEKIELIIEQKKSGTNLQEVGFQLWTGALFLCDYLLFNHKNVLNDKIVIDLGAGVGLTSLVASLYASKVYCTDLEYALGQAEHNFNLNKATLSLKQVNHIDFRILDWCKDNQILEEFHQANVFIAADVIYDDDLTIAFLKTLFNLMKTNKNQPKCAFISIDKRVNFELESLREDSSIYNFFEKSMFELNDYEEDGILFKAEQIQQDFPQFILNYERNKYLSLWKIQTC